MDRAIVPSAAATSTDGIAAMLAWPTALAETLCQTQRAQIEAMAAWQQAIAGFTQEVWDEWIAHWAGGVPLEG